MSLTLFLLVDAMMDTFHLESYHLPEVVVPHLEYLVFDCVVFLPVAILLFCLKTKPEIYKQNYLKTF